MIKNITNISLIVLVATLSGSASARVNFGFSVVAPQPVYYQPAPVAYCSPSVGFGFGTSGFNLGFNFPVLHPPVVVRKAQPARAILDAQGRDYWKIFNNTDVAITVSAQHTDGLGYDSVTIRPGSSNRLFRFNTYGLKIRAHDGQVMRFKSNRHNVIVGLTRFDELCCVAK